MDWQKDAVYGSLGRVEGMNDWPRSSILAWIELSKLADNVLKMKDGERKKNKLSMISGRRSGIIKDAEGSLFNGQNCTKGPF